MITIHGIDVHVHPTEVTIYGVNQNRIRKMFGWQYVHTLTDSLAI